MRALQKCCGILILTAVAGFGISAQEGGKRPPEKEKTPGAKVEKNKNDDKPQDNRNRGNDNKNRDNRDKGNKKPPGEK